MKHTTARRLPALLLVLALLLGALSMSACGNTEETPDETRETAASTEAETEDPRRCAPDSLPDDLRFDGTTIRILTRIGDVDTKMEFIAEKDSAEIVEAAVYERNAMIEDRFGITFEFITVTDDRGTGGSINDLVTRTVSTGTDEYDIVSNHMSQTTTSVLRGCFQNLNALEYLDWTQPWWNSSYQDEVTVSGKQYTAAGELALSYISGMYSMFFNKSLWDKYYPGEPSLYETVRSGKWTLDKMTAYITDFNQDTDGKPGINDGDLVGYYYQTLMADAFAGACNIRFAEYDEEADEYAFVLNNEHTMDFIDRMTTLLFDSNGTVFGNESHAEALKRLSEDKALFTVAFLSGALYVRSMENDYGIIPLPKMTEEQASYSGFVHNGFSAFSIPATVKEGSNVAAVMEAMCAQSYRTVTPAYFDTALKFKYARDPEAASMLDTISESVRFDFCYVFNQSLNTVAATFRTILGNKSNAKQGASTIKGYDKSTEKAIKTLVKTIQKLKV